MFDSRAKNIQSLADRAKSFDDFSGEQAKVLLGKGRDYTGGKADQDANHTFRLLAYLLEGATITPYTVALIFKMKHTLSLLTFAKTGKQDSGESIRGRHIDDCNYGFICSQLVEDHEAWLGAREQQNVPQKIAQQEERLSEKFAKKREEYLLKVLETSPCAAKPCNAQHKDECVVDDGLLDAMKPMSLEEENVEGFLNRENY